MNHAAVCAWCGLEFYGRRSDASYCCQACRQKAHRHPATASRRRSATDATSGATVDRPLLTTDATWLRATAPRSRPATALYVDRHGPYPALVGWDACWTAERDARLWDGPGPGVFHPPCAPWCVARHLSTGANRDCAPRAVEQVRKCGGVLEHPARSLLWAYAGLPRPGDPPDRWGGISIAVEQARWGHGARKPTWLYLVRAWIPPFPEGDLPANLRGVFDLGQEDARRTPPAFAAWLLAAATGDPTWLATDDPPATATDGDGYQSGARDGCSAGGGLGRHRFTWASR